MKMNLYPKLAWHGLVKNKKTYLPFLLTSIGIMTMYYIISYLTYSKSVYNLKGGAEMQMILSWGTVVIAVFAVIFLFYMNSFLMSQRKKEFGLYNILGMGKRNIGLIILWQNGILFVSSFVGGLGLGILLSKLSELCAAKMLKQTAALEFSIEWQSIHNTALLTIVAFTLILIYSLGQIHVANPIELLNGSKKGEKPPKARWFITLVGLALLGAAYYLAITTKEPMTALAVLFIAVLMVVAATYLLFICGSVALCKILQKNKQYYYKTSHFVSVSSMAYRMKRNGASLASICTLSTMVLVMISSTLSLYIGSEDSLRKIYPKDIRADIYSADEYYVNEVKNAFAKTFEEYGVTPEDEETYRYLDFFGKSEQDKLIMDIDDDFSNYSKLLEVIFFTLDDYTRITGKNETLGDREVLTYMVRGEYDYDAIQIGNLEPLRIKDKAEKFVNIQNSMVSTTSAMYVIVPDLDILNEIFEYQKTKYVESYSSVETCYSFNLSCDDETQIGIINDVSQKISELQLENPNFVGVEFSSITEGRNNFYTLYGGLLFLGILLSIVFLFATVLIMYYKQISEGYEDSARFEIMQKVGMTKKEIRRSINSQVLTVFAAPLLAAGIHTAFAFPLIRRLMVLLGLTNIMLFIGVTVGSFLIFAIFYIVTYRLTSHSYYQLVK